MIIAIVGTGRMGAAIAKRIPAGHECVLINNGSSTGEKLAEQISAVHTTDISKVSVCDVIILCVPASATAEVVRKAASFAKEGALLVNSSTKAFIEEDVMRHYSQLHFVEAKIVGHAASLEKGAPAYVIVDTKDNGIYKVIATLLAKMGYVGKGDVNRVPTLSTLAAEAGIKTAVALRTQLTSYGLPKELEDVLIESVCAGTMGAYIKNELGHFGRELAEKLESEIGGNGNERDL